MKHSHKFSRANIGLENNPGVYSTGRFILIVESCECGKVRQSKIDVASSATFTRFGNSVTSSDLAIPGFSNWKYKRFSVREK